MNKKTNNNIAFTEFVNIKQNDELISLVEETLNKCYENEHLFNVSVYIGVTLTDSKYIQELNKIHRSIDKQTDVLSFPMFEKEELQKIIDDRKNNTKNCTYEEMLGDIVINVSKVEEQAIEYKHSFKREFSYMLVHGFYHLMGYDHEIEEDKNNMRKKEEEVLLKIV